MFEGAEWLTDYVPARAAGKAIEPPLPDRAPISQLFEDGLRRLRSAKQPSEDLAP